MDRKITTTLMAAIAGVLFGLWQQSLAAGVFNFSVILILDTLLNNKQD